MRQHPRYRFTPAIVALTTAALMQVQASAAPITFVATGTVDSVDSSLSDTFSVGQIFTMTYTFDSSTAPRGGSNSTFAEFDAIQSQGFTLGSYSGSATGPEEIQIDNDPPLPSHDRYSPGPGVASVETGDPVDGLTLQSFFFRLDDATNTAFSSALILPTTLSLNSFTSSAFEVDFQDANGGVHSVTGQLTSLVPEPTTLILAALGGLALLAMRRRRGH